MRASRASGQRYPEGWSQQNTSYQLSDYGRLANEFEQIRKESADDYTATIVERTCRTILTVGLRGGRCGELRKREDWLEQ
jgi:hypothetical protein